jgi:succinate-semialdehyde dehydrogenase/glutarate-semialdehyde dehydrogenase
VTGGSAVEGPGYFYQPTILKGVTEGTRILSEEIFGPVAPIITFDTEDEAVAWGNSTIMGLVSYVYGSLASAMRVAHRLDSGMVAVNRGVVSDPAAPFGGVKQSGIGREGGFDGIGEYLEEKYIAVDM